MLTKFFGATLATLGIILAFVVIAIIGVAAMFVGYFLFWGLIAVCIIVGIWFLIWCAIEEYKLSKALKKAKRES